MRIRESVPLSSLTTLKVGGTAKCVVTCESIEDVKTAIAFARDRGLSWYVLGGGSNLLAADEGFDGVIIKMEAGIEEIRFEYVEERVLAIATAGTSWDRFVDACVEKDLWGVENLAGIPGTVGAAPVQNIGAYGVEVADTLAWVETYNPGTDEVVMFERDACEFGYRDSIFKRTQKFIILRVAFALTKHGEAKTSYKDIAMRIQEGASAQTPKEVAELVRSIRTTKFPDLTVCGTAGSFFKNPVISKEEYADLQNKYPNIPGYETGDGIKVSLAWVLDNVLHLKGHAEGKVRLFEKQPLVLVIETGATAHNVDAFANEIAKKVFNVTHISIEREVQNLK